MIAARYLYTKKKESFINIVSLFSLIGIAIGVAALIVVMAVMNGFRSELITKIIGFNGDISIQGYYPISDYKQVKDKLLLLEEVIAAIPIVEQQVLMYSNSISSGSQVRGIEKEDILSRDIIKIVSGNLNNFTEYNILLGETLAFNLGVGVGDSVKIVSLQTNTTVIGKVPRFKTLKVIGIFKSGMSEYDSIASFIPLSTAQTLFRMKEKVNSIEVSTKDPTISNKTKFKIMGYLDNKYPVLDWQTRNASFFNALKTERVAMFVILSLIIIVAAFNIISSLIMLVKDKTSDIAILRTIGASKGSIIRIFIITGSTLGLLGTSIGLILGISFAKNIDEIKRFLEGVTGTKLFDPLIYYLSSLPSKIIASDVIMVVSISTTLSILATIYPAWRAARLDPVKALRYE